VVPWVHSASAATTWPRSSTFTQWVDAHISGGERQRVAIGRALVTDPALILVDEPTASLDTQLGTQVVELLADEIKKRDKSGIMVTHDTRMVRFADRALAILDGVVTETSPAGSR
jgi:putative ABC transport system ATP-binding protein